VNKLVFKVFFTTIFWILLFMYAFPWSAYDINVPFSWQDYKLWLDLQWWIELDYKVDLDEAKKDPTYNKSSEKDIIEWLKSIIDKRVESLKISDSVITSADYAWEQHIIVQIPLKWTNTTENNENIKKAKDAIWKVVKIEFREARNSITAKDREERKALAWELLKKAQESSNFNVVSNEFKDTYENVSIWSLTWSTSELKKYFTLSWSAESWVYNKVLSWSWKEVVSYDEEKKEFLTNAWDKGYYVINISNITKSPKDNKNIFTLDYVFLSENPSTWTPAKDGKWRVLNDKYFLKSSVQFNEVFQPMVELTFNDEWAKIFWELTKKLVNKQIAIFVWWEMLTAPNVNEPILNWKAVITWNYTPESAKKLSQDINTWVVPAPIYLTSEKTIDSRLGASSLQKLIYSWLFWFFLILVFLIYTYRLAWAMSIIWLVFYVLIVLSLVKAFWIVLTLASIAWLILSVGMAIDANILVFERLREELAEWKWFHEAIKIWFSKSWTAIWDSHITWLIVSVILFIFGINMIKWFWLMLAIWIIISLFSVMWISRVWIIVISKIVKKKWLFIWK
jgi:protein-export membrane protein SecD